MRLRSTCLAVAAAGALVLAPVAPALAAGHGGHGLRAAHHQGVRPTPPVPSIASQQAAAGRALTALDAQLAKLATRSSSDPALQAWADDVAGLIDDARTAVAGDVDAVNAATTADAIRAAVSAALAQDAVVVVDVASLEQISRVSMTAGSESTEASTDRDQLATVAAGGVDVSAATTSLDDADAQLATVQSAVDAASSDLLAGDTSSVSALRPALAAAATDLRPTLAAQAHARADLRSVARFLRSQSAG